MSDLVRNLRDRRIMVNGGNGNVYDIADEDCERAADRIEALEAALQKIADLVDSDTGEPLDDAIETARAALAPEQDK